MNMNPRMRKSALAAHIIFSVGWLGAVVAYLALAVVGLWTADGRTAGAAYIAMNLIAKMVIVPFSIATLLMGLIESLGTSWGLFRHWWVLSKFVLTTVATIILVEHLSAIAHMATLAADMTLAATDFRDLRIQLLVHAAGGLFVLLVATLLSVYKPWGMTPYGARNRSTLPVSAPEGNSSEGLERPVQVSPSFSRTPPWAYIIGFHVAGLLVLFLFAHLTGLHHINH
jgi:vacuolar-type H+-ATPase subunit I/STV1